jgi:flagellar protein FlgJ
MEPMDLVPLPGAASPVGAEGPVAAASDAGYRAQAQAAAEKFESFFIAEMMKQMRRSTRELSGDEGLFKDRVHDDMLGLADGLVADALSGQHAFGVADAILRQLLPAEVNAKAAAVAMDKKKPSTELP